MSDFTALVKVKRGGPRGWHWIERAKYDADPDAFELVDPLDHDADGKKGGSVVKSELAQLRLDYKEAFGKGPSPKWDADTLRAKIAEKAQE